MMSSCVLKPAIDKAISESYKQLYPPTGSRSQQKVENGDRGRYPIQTNHVKYEGKL